MYQTYNSNPWYQMVNSTTVQQLQQSLPPDIPAPLPPRNPFVESIEQYSFRIFKPIEADLRYLYRFFSNSTDKPSS